MKLVNEQLRILFRAPLAIGAIGLVVVLLGGCQQAQPKVELTNASSQGEDDRDPESAIGRLVDRLRAAEVSERYEEIYDGLEPAQRGQVLMALWFGAAYAAMGAEPAVVEGYEGLVETHGLDERWLNEKVKEPDDLTRIIGEAFRGKKLRPLFADLLRFQFEHSAHDEGLGLPSELDELQVQGDLARATAGDESQVYFVRRDGSWYWRLLPEEPIEEEGR